MSASVKIICPLCYSPELDMYMEGMAHSAIGALSMPAGNVGANNMELTCRACGHVFKPADGKLSQDAGSSTVPQASVYPGTAINREYLKMLTETQGKLVAIKYACDTYQWGLKEARDYIDQLAADSKSYEELPYRTGATPDDHKVSELLQQKGKLLAVKYVKDTTGWSLKASKDYVDHMARNRGIRGKEGCFVATACYGDYEAPEVQVLRRYRDTVLARSAGGRVFIWLYYRVSPPLARGIARSEGTRRWLRQWLLTPLCRRLEARS